MRVLIVADIVGGVRTFVRELVPQLAASGVEVHLALIGDPQKATNIDGASSCETRDLRLEWMDESWSDVETTAMWVHELTQRYQPDVLHMNTFTPVVDPAVPVVVTVHSCVLTWWRAVHGTDAPATWQRYRRLAYQALRRASLLTVPTQALLRELQAVYPVIPRARVIPNGRSLTPPEASKERLVVSAGRIWDEAKNVQLLAHAAPQIEARVVLMGRGSAHGVECLGELQEAEVQAWLTRATVFAEPARYEPFGLAALEAALCGCALVLGDIPSLHEVWGDAATYVDPDDHAALATTINALLNDHQRSALQAQRRARRYAPATMARAYRDAYAALTRSALAA